MPSGGELVAGPAKYGIRLLWREEALSRGIAFGRSGLWSKSGGISDQRHSNFNHDWPLRSQNERVDGLALPTHEWMFLNTTCQDFKRKLEAGGVRNDSTLDEASDYAPSCPLPAFAAFAAPCIQKGHFSEPEDPLAATPQILFRNNLSLDDVRGVSMFKESDSGVSLLTPRNQTQISSWSNRTFSWPIARNPSPLALGDNEIYLLDYFTHGVSPRCTTWPADNPFARTMLPICMSGPNKPLFNIVIAVASHQLSLLNDTRFRKDIWIYRGKALRAFQAEMGRLQSGRECSVDWEQVISTLVMLTFFDKELYKFFFAYFAQHEALSRTTSALSDPHDGQPMQWFPPELDIDMTIIDSLLGCSHELIYLISSISDLATRKQSQTYGSRDQVLEAADGVKQEHPAALKEHRDSIERQLHALIQHLPPDKPDLPGYATHGSSTIEELAYIAETRRLSALIYLYFRIDGLSPGHSPISRITGQILALIPKISLRSHALLWTLFIVGTMGIGQGDGDPGRKFILERLVSLQRTRELENVRIAREVVEAVWKIRDSRGPEYVSGTREDRNMSAAGETLLMLEVRV
ncbi:hypothetical protein NCS57_01098400 [Fusarium keratoplasticum]|uniref:Uncharacterized protein n=1 Tax=Fusarium keratoplasticum TaxID=1328300 RepID=A0ACC0QJJ9_9HYPO|nr:hypothetical protein NCS57_01098400 [Fusarium keratoplasticum]KAI8657207.1 hypothetical protein NCS57_01098400 [Fusarium keratoplasticum]